MKPLLLASAFLLVGCNQLQQPESEQPVPQQPVPRQPPLQLLDSPPPVPDQQAILQGRLEAQDVNFPLLLGERVFIMLGPTVNGTHPRTAEKTPYYKLKFQTLELEQAAHKLWESIIVEEPKRVEAKGLLQVRGRARTLITSSIRRTPDPEADTNPEFKSFWGFLDARRSGLYFKVQITTTPVTYREFRLLVPKYCLQNIQDFLDKPQPFSVGVGGRIHQNAVTGETILSVDHVSGAPSPGYEYMRSPTPRTFVGTVEEHPDGSRFLPKDSQEPHVLILTERLKKILKERLKDSRSITVEGHAYYDAYTKTRFLKVVFLPLPGLQR